MRLPFPKPDVRLWAGPALIALLVWAAVIGRIDPAGSYPRAPQGPGLTLDESFNVQQGARLVEALRGWALGALTWREVFGTRQELGPHARFGYHLPDHPPLGRLWIGLFHNVTRAVVPPEETTSPFVTACARTGPATAFALTVFLIGWTAARWHGPVAGIVGAASVALMPRLFAHAHLAALETFLGLTYAAAVLAVPGWWTADGRFGPAVYPAAVGGRRRSGWEGSAACGARSCFLWQPAGAGFLLGLALLAKIQAVFLPLPVAVWALAHGRRKALLPLAVWGSVGLAVFFVFWPWLWFDPPGNFLEYLGRTTDRVSLFVWYLGERFEDTKVPWHYPLVLFATTVPAGLHALGVWGLLGGERPGWRDPRLQLVLAAAFVPLVVLSVPGVPVYDGARLFLVAFPLWGILIGRGGSAALAWLARSGPAIPRIGRRVGRRSAAAALALFVALQGYGVVAMQPCQLSYYNLFVGGLRGAERLGLETTYWGDSVTRDVLQAAVEVIPEGAVLEVAPVLHPFQLSELERQSPLLLRRGVQLRPLAELSGPSRPSPAPRYVLLFRRKADLPEDWRDGAPAGRPLVELRRHGVWLAAVYELPGAGTAARSAREIATEDTEVTEEHARRRQRDEHALK